MLAEKQHSDQGRRHWVGDNDQRSVNGRRILHANVE
jgi:hypothetical protein